MAKASDSITGNLCGFCKITAKARGDISRITGATDSDEVLKQGWKNAYDAKKYRVKGNLVTFVIDATPFGRDAWAEVILKESNREGEALPYYTCGADALSEPPRDYESLEDFAFFRQDKQRDLYKELAGIALEEPWSFTGNGNDLLKFYLNGTFLRLVDEGKLGYATDTEGEMCVWCTGLVDAHYEDIFCFCVPNDRAGARQKWVVQSFCTSGSTHYGQRLRRAFGTTPPSRANYFESIADTIYDGNLALVVDYGHIMRRIHRIGIPALRFLLASSKEALKVIERASSAKQTAREDILKELNDLVAANTGLQQSLHNALALAAERARARARYMYTSALPAWNPKGGGKVAFCLPLCLEVEERVDTVLVAQLVKEAKDPFYEGKTIFSLPMAYRTVRTIQRTDGMTGWVSSAFSSDEDMPSTSAFATPSTTVASMKAQKTSFSATPICADSVAVPSVAIPSRGRLVPDSDEFSKLMVCSGDTVGLVRRPNDIQPRIQLPTQRGFEGVSQIHGKFECRNGAWTYTHEGTNWTNVTRKDGSSVFLDTKGQTVPVAFGDSLSFADSPEYRFER